MPEWLKSSNQPSRSTVYGRMYASCGVAAPSASVEAGNAPWRSLPFSSTSRTATSRSGTCAFVRSSRSLPLPGAFSIRLRSANVGRASCASGRSSARNGRSFFATGFESSTSGSRSSSAARRFRNVVLARRMKAGSCSTDSASACCSEPIAFVVVARLSTRPERSSWRSARSVTSWEEETTKRSSSFESEFSSRNRREEACSDGFRYSSPAFIWSPRPSCWAAEPLITFCRSRRVAGSSVLKIWSRSTAVVVASCSSTPLIGDRGRAVARQAQVDVAVGDAGQRRLADGRERPAAQRRVVAVDAQRDLGLAVVRQPDVLDLAGGHAGDLHEVALDELGRVLEARLHLVAAARAAAEQHDGHEHRGGHEGDKRDDARKWGCSAQGSSCSLPRGVPTRIRARTCENV